MRKVLRGEKLSTRSRCLGLSLTQYLNSIHTTSDCFSDIFVHLLFYQLLPVQQFYHYI